VLVVEQIQASLTKAHEAVFMYELSSALGGKRTQEAVARTVAQQVRQLFQASLVRVGFQPENRSPSVVVGEPKDAATEDPPDRTIPIENAWGLVGEIQIWGGDYADLPAEDSRLLQNFAVQTAQALERTRLSESRDAIHTAAPKASAK
jgi:K+-sensing histidine kinase KdpD